VRFVSQDTPPINVLPIQPVPVRTKPDFAIVAAN
jgi:hypothetical protein